MSALKLKKGATAIVLHSDHGQIEAMPIRAFEPFTKSPVLLVELEAADIEPRLRRETCTNRLNHRMTINMETDEPLKASERESRRKDRWSFV